MIDLLPGEVCLSRATTYRIAFMLSPFGEIIILDHIVRGKADEERLKRIVVTSLRAMNRLNAEHAEFTEKVRRIQAEDSQ